jgi:uncharacterized protein (TIGR02265 family)
MRGIPVNMTKEKSEPIIPKYNYRGKTVTNNGETYTPIKHIALESMLKGANLHDNAAFLAEIKPFYDPAYSRAEYTVEIYTEVLDRLCDWMYPHLSREEGREQVGRLIFQGFRKTITGRVGLAALHLFGPARLLTMSPRLFEDGAGVGKRTVTQLDTNKYLFTLRNIAGTHEDTIGIIKAGLEAVGAKNVRCEITINSPSSWDFVIEWD